MKDERKTKKQLINELTQLRQQLSQERRQIEVRHANAVEGQDQDASVRQQMEELLRVSVEQCHTIINTLSDAICLLDSQGRIQRCNRAMVELVDRPLGKILDHHCWEVVHGEPGPVDGCPVVRMWETLSRERMILPVGDRWFDVSADPLLVDDGESIGAVLVMTDITERVRLEEERAQTRAALTESEELLRITLENILDPIFITDDMGKFTYICPNVPGILGYSVEEIRAMGNISLLIRGDLPLHQELQALGEIRNIEGAIETKSGDTRDFLVSAKRVSIGDGTILYSCRDITERKQAEEAVHASQRELKRTLEATTDGIWTWDFVSDQLTFSPRYYEMLGYAPGEFPATYENWSALIHPDDRASALAVANEYLKEKPDEYENEFRLRTKDGNYRWIHTKGRVVERDKQGRAVYMIGNHEDITERRQTQEERDRITDLSQDLICIASLDGHFEFLNPAWEATLGYPREEMLSRPFLDFIHPDDHSKTDAEVKRLAAGKLTADFENRYFHKDGSIRMISWRTTPVPEEGGIYCIGRDVTEQRRAEEALRESEEKLRLALEGAIADSWEMDLTTGTLTFSDRWARHMGYGPGEVAQTMEAVQGIVHPDDLQRTFDDLNAYVKGETPFYETECRLRRKGGDYVWVLSRGQAVTYDRDGHPARLLGTNFDITERKRVEEALRESEQRFRQIFARAPISIWEEDFSAVGDWLAELRARGVHDLDAFLQAEPQALEQALALVRLVDINDTTLQLFEASSKEELLNLWTSLFTDDTFDVFAEELRVIWEGRNQVDFECSAQTVRGRPIHYLLHWVVPLEDGRMNLRHVIVAIADITERKRAEEALRISDNAIASSITAIAIAEFAGNLTYVNTAFLRMWDYEDEDEVLGKPAVEFWQTSEEATRVIEALENRGGWIGELVAKRKDGSLFDVQLSASIVTDENGKLTNMMASFVDITERKQAEEALRESERRYRLLVENTTTVAWITGRDGKTIFVSPNVERVYGYTPGEIMKAGEALWFGRVHPEDRDRVKGGFESLFSKQEQFDLEYRLQRKDGSWIWVHDRASVVEEKDGSPYAYGVFSDITYRKEAEEALQLRTKQLQQLARQIVSAQEDERKRVALELHDELGQALTAIDFDIAAMEEALMPRLDPVVEQRLTRVKSLLSDMDEQVSAMALNLRPSMLDDLGLIPALRWYVGRYVDRVDVRVDLEASGLSERLPQETETVLYRIVQEALTNVAKHAQASRVSIHLECGVSSVTVTIRDDGLGFDMEGVADLQPSRQGIGLLGMQERAASLGGGLSIESRPGEGTRLTIEIPLREGGPS